MQKADLRRHLEHLHPNAELEQWFDPLGVRVNGALREIQVSFPHAPFAEHFGERVRLALEQHCLPLLQGWSLHWVQPGGPPRPGTGNSGGGSPLPRHTFETFLHNRKNDFPLAAARACAAAVNNPPYSPLVLHGQSGSGKTHLLGAIATEAARVSPGLRFFYGPARYLPEQEIFAAVFLDDVHHVVSAEYQERLAGLLDAMQAGGGAFVCTLDAPPSACLTLSTALAQRLCAGLVVEVKKPDLEVRRRYAADLCETHGLPAGKEETLALAQRCTDFRSIDGAVTRARAYASLFPEKAAGQMSMLHTAADQKCLAPEHIIAVVARFFSIPPEHLVGKNRDKTAAEARRHALMLCRELLGLSLPQLGRIFGNRDHSSVAYLLKKFKEIQSGNNDMHNTFSRLKQMCLNSAP